MQWEILLIEFLFELSTFLWKELVFSELIVSYMIQIIYSSFENMTPSPSLLYYNSHTISFEGTMWSNFLHYSIWILLSKTGIH